MKSLSRHPFSLFLVLLKAGKFGLIGTVKREARFLKTRTVNAKTHSYKFKLVLDRLPEINFLPQPFNGKFTKIGLANETIDAVPDINWSNVFHDEEDIFALNRFGWLLAALLENPSVELAEKALHWIDSWIEEMGERKSHPAWQSYTVAERLANWPFILLIARKLISIPKELIDKLETVIISHIEYLLSHIEFRGTLTNNHILNDARGLYIAGVAMEHTWAKERAREIFYKWTERLIHADAMLKEHSSHYQYLICQRYEQVFLVARYAEDSPFCDFMGKWVKSMKQACDFFSVYDKNGKWDMPFIGNISPDFTPRWLAPNSERGWSRLGKWMGKGENVSAVNQKRDGQRSNGQLKTMNGGFIRYDIGDIVVFWHVETEGLTYRNHGHYDTGSFVLFYKGKQVFADTGLYSYLKVNSYSKGARAHSTLIVDSLGAYCEDNRLNRLSVYRYRPPRCKILESDGRLNLKIEINGFTRLITPVRWEREFTVKKDRLIIADRLESAGNNQVETRFQVDPLIKAAALNGEVVLSSEKENLMSLKVDDSHSCQCTLLRGGSNSGEEGWCSKEYGSRFPGTTIVYRHRLYRPGTHRYEIRWEK